MLDIRFIREHPDLVRQGMDKKGEDPARVDQALRLDEQRRQLIQRVEGLKNQRNTASAQVARLKSRGEDADAVIAETRALAD